jgi:hypothetical protein
MSPFESPAILSSKIGFPMSRLKSVSTIVLACGLAAGCDDAPPLAPDEPAPVQLSETFAGTLNVNGAAMHTFLIAEGPGRADAILESLSPDSAAVVSFIFGTWNGNYCQVIFVKDDATTGSQFVGTASSGAFCVRVSDIGRLTQPTDYSIKVQHF